MKRPTWATIIGVLAIIFGILGILGGAQDIAMPFTIEMQQKMAEGMAEVQKDVPVEQQNADGTPNKSKVIDAMEEKFQFPDWYTQFSMVFGIIAMLVSAIYLMAGISLLMTKIYAIKAIVAALGLSVVWAVVQYFIFVQTANFMLMAQMPMAIASIVIDIVFLIVVLVGNKEAFTGDSPHLPLEIQATA